MKREYRITDVRFRVLSTSRSRDVKTTPERVDGRGKRVGAGQRGLRLERYA